MRKQVKHIDTSDFPPGEEMVGLLKLPDSKIDTSDIPEVTDFSKGERGKFYRIKTAFWVDLMGAGGKTPEEEMEQHREWIEEELGVRLDIHMPYNISQIEEGTDLVLFDYGGMMLGNSLMEDNSRRLVRWAEDHPSALVVIISTFTYDQAVRHEIAEHLGIDSVPYHYNVPEKDRGTTPMHNITVFSQGENTYPDWFRKMHGCAAKGEYRNIGKLTEPLDEVKQLRPESEVADALLENMRCDPFRLRRVQETLDRMVGKSASLPAQTFFNPKKNFLDFMKKRFRLRYVYDVGAGQGHVTVALRKAGVKKVNPIDIFPRDGQDTKINHGDGTTYPFKANSLVMLCRPCHGMFAEDTIKNALKREVSSILYVGLAKNVKNDLGGFYRKFKRVLVNIGEDKENLWVYQP
jgi:hypothetical protein